MAAILRLAGGLDRSRSQQVRDVLVRVDDERITLQVVSEQEPQVDIWGAERRTELFEKVFGVPLVIHWASRSPERPAAKEPSHRKNGRGSAGGGKAARPVRGKAGKATDAGVNGQSDKDSSASPARG
jgi:hypothetical protein